MDLEQYKALLYLVSGISIFVIMTLVMRLLSLAKKSDSKSSTLGTHESWTNLEDLQVIGIQEEARAIKSFRLMRTQGRMLPAFQAGQFVSFQIGEKKAQVRSYSISSMAQNRESLQVTVKLIPGGVGSEWFHKLKVGDMVKAFPPTGHFLDNSKSTKERIYIAGGVGITPILSILSTNIEQKKTYPMNLFYAVRTQEDLAFHELFLYWQRTQENFQYFPILSEDSSWLGEKGFLSFEFIKKNHPSVESALLFLCGPEPMVKPLLNKFAQIGIAEDNIHNESFVSPTQLDPESIKDLINDSNLGDATDFQVKFREKKYKYKTPQDLLSFLEEQGEEIPYACRSGVCGSCRCKLLRGQVHSLTDAGLTKKEKDEGYFLSCVSFPKEDLDIDT